jgi:hypothetical protein
MQPRSQNSRELSFAGFNAQMSADNVEMAEAKLREIIEEALEDGVIEPKEQQLIDNAKQTLENLKKKEHNVNKKIVAMIASDMAADANNLCMSGATSIAQAKFEVSNSKMGSLTFCFHSHWDCCDIVYASATIEAVDLHRCKLVCSEQNSPRRRVLAMAGFNALVASRNVEMAEAKLQEITSEALEDGVIEQWEQELIDKAAQNLESLKQDEHLVAKHIGDLIVSDSNFVMPEPKKKSSAVREFVVHSRLLLYLSIACLLSDDILF